MKIKLLLFPLAIVVAITLSIFSIKPEVMEILAKTTELKIVKDKIASTNASSNKIEAQAGELAKNSDKENYLKGYLPENKEEQEIFYKVSKIASNANVSLLNLNVSEKGGAGASDAKQKEAGKIKYVYATAEVFGSYENIKSFISYLHAIEKFGKVTSFSISPVAKENKPSASASADGVTVTVTVDDSPSDALSAKIEISFGYFPRESRSDIASFSNKDLDFSVIANLKTLITRPVAPITEVPGGKTNPFLSTK